MILFTKIKNQASISSFFTPKEDTTRKWHATDGGRQKLITNAIVTFVAKDLRPLSVAESEAFRNLLHIAEPQYSMPTRKYLKKQVTNHYSTL